MKKIQPVRGTHDLVGKELLLYNKIKKIISEIANNYDFTEIITPIFESSELFQKPLGKHSDIVLKEMYTFEDRNGDSLSLRPEGTAGCVRAGIQSGILYRQVQRLWYSGPMFRHERPQKGRYRQFSQFGVEAFGMPSAAIDAELIAMNAAIFKALSLQDKVQLQINTLGTADCRKVYKEKLITYFQQHLDELDDDSKKRLSTNPLRILDSKNPSLKELIASAPLLRDSLSVDALAHHEQLCAHLDLLGIDFIENPHLVRGLDYYGLTVFEWVTDALGAQGTLSAGGRYDVLVEQLGGESTPAAGFALGLDRVVALLSDLQVQVHSPLDFYFVPGDMALSTGLVLKLAQELRAVYPKAVVKVDLSATSFKKKLKRLDQSTAQIAIIIGDSEIESDTVLIKNLAGEKEQIKLTQAEFLEKISFIATGES